MAALVSSTLVAGSATAQGSEKKVTMRDLPPAVQPAVKEQISGATLHALAMETEDGKTLYEAELRVNGRTRSHPESGRPRQAAVG